MKVVGSILGLGLHLMDGFFFGWALVFRFKPRQQYRICINLISFINSPPI